QRLLDAVLTLVATIAVVPSAAPAAAVVRFAPAAAAPTGKAGTVEQVMFVVLEDLGLAVRAAREDAQRLPATLVRVDAKGPVVDAERLVAARQLPQPLRHVDVALCRAVAGLQNPVL